MLSRKYYEIIADEIREVTKKDYGVKSNFAVHEAIEEIIQGLCKAFERDNPYFKEDKFINRCYELED